MDYGATGVGGCVRAALAALPADCRSAQRQDCRRGSTGALAAPKSRLVTAGSVPARGGIARFDAGNWHMAATRSLSPDARLATSAMEAVPSGRQCIRTPSRSRFRWSSAADYLEIGLTETEVRAST